MTDATPKVDTFKAQLEQRQRVGRRWARVFYASNLVAILTLIALAFNIANSAFGYVAVQYKIDPAVLSPDAPLDTLDETALVQIIQREAPRQVRVMIRDSISRVPNDVFSQTPLQTALAGAVLPAGTETQTISQVTDEQAVQILADNMDRDRIYALVLEKVAEPQIRQSWPLVESLTQRGQIEATIAEKYPEARLVFRSWVSGEFLRNPIGSDAATAGLRTALYGTLWVISITVLFSFPLGVGAAIYLEEYASDTWLNRLIETNIRNLAGVPSIIYGMLGLTVFVRLLGDITSGAAFGVTDSNGRTVLSAGLTLGLVILPVIIINAQEAIRAVPSSIREASYGLGATKWQTISRQVLPAALPGILTGIILSLSRAVGETAPLIVVGASTFISLDPSGPFSKFTVVPIQIFEWTSKPQPEFRNAAAAAIIVLMTVLILLNSTAIYLRNRFSRKLAGY